MFSSRLTDASVGASATDAGKVFHSGVVFGKKVRILRHWVLRGSEKFERVI